MNSTIEPVKHIEDSGQVKKTVPKSAKSFKKRVSKFFKKIKEKVLPKMAIYIVLLNLSFIFLYPFIYMIVTSFKSYSDLMDVTVKWYPREFTPQNWKHAYELLNLPRTFFNSLFVTILSTVGHVLSCSVVAYGFARYEFPFKKVLFFLVVLTIIVPIQTIIVPQFQLYDNYGWSRSYLPIVLPTFLGMGLRGGLFIFLFRQFFLRLPPSLEEAAAIDGCNAYTTFIRIIIPTSGAVMLVCIILSIVWHWNDYFEPSIYLNADLKLLPQTLPDMYANLQDLQNMAGEGEIMLREIFTDGVAMAGTAIAVSPLLIMFMFLQNKFVESIDRTGIVE